MGLVLFCLVELSRVRLSLVVLGLKRWGWVQFGLVGLGFGLGWNVLVNFTGVFPENFNDLGIFFIQGWGWVGVGERG